MVHRICRRVRPVRRADARHPAGESERGIAMATVRDSSAVGAPTTTIGHWIGGGPWSGTSERWGDVFNPATGEHAARVAFADARVVDEAVRVATEAARTWGRTSLAARTRVMFAFRELTERRKRDIAEILTREHGK